MGQTEYADNIIDGFLNGLRWLAAQVTGLFQSGSGSGTLNWFAANWLKILIVLVVIGILVDWLIWMIRWRPHWLWFGKKRVLYDDEEERYDRMYDLDDEPDDWDELEQDDAFSEVDDFDEFDDLSEKDEARRPVFRSSALHKRPTEGDFEERFDEEAEMTDDTRNWSLSAGDRKAVSDDSEFDPWDEDEEYAEEEEDEEESPRGGLLKRIGLFRRGNRDDDEEFDEDELYDEDEFYDEEDWEEDTNLLLTEDESKPRPVDQYPGTLLDPAQDAPAFHVEEPVIDKSSWRTGYTMPKDALHIKQPPAKEDEAWHTGYTAKQKPVDPDSPGLSRKMRRRLKEMDDGGTEEE